MIHNEKKNQPICSRLTRKNSVIELVDKDISSYYNCITCPANRWSLEEKLRVSAMFGSVPWSAGMVRSVLEGLE